MTRPLTSTIYRLFAALLVMLVSQCVYSQNSWNLTKCIEHARTNNLKVQAAAISTEKAAVSLNESKLKLLPSLEYSASQNFINKKEPNLSGTYEGKTSYSGTYSLTSSMVLFNGGKLKNNVQQQLIASKKSESDLHSIQNDIEIAVTQGYLQLLYANETLKANIKNRETSQANLLRAAELLSAGSISKADYAQLEALLSNDSYQVTIAENDLALAKLELKQLLELPLDSNTEFEFPEIGDKEVLTKLPSMQEVYAKASETMPNIESSKYAIEIAKVDAQNAKASRLPSVTLNASAGTGNYSNSGYTLYNQLNNGFNQSVGVTVSVPIFKNGTVKSGIERTKLQLREAELGLASESKELQKTVETLYQNAIAGRSKFLAAKDKFRSTELSYKLVQEQFNAGMKNTVELLTETSNLQTAQAGLIQAKYQSALSAKLLLFYYNQPITL